MNWTPDTPPLEGITYTDNLPLAWEQISDMPGDGELNRINRDNEDLLQALLILTEPLSEHEEEDEGPGSENLKRVEAKLNLMLGLLGEILLANYLLPDTWAVQVGTRGFSVHDKKGSDLSNDSLLKIKLYLDPKFPRPLLLYGRVQDVHDDGFALKYLPLEARLQDLLDKYVFRQHRRAVALSRRRENP
jgi:hypothetical protein